MIRSWRAVGFHLLLLWHGLLAGSYTVAYLTSEGGRALHEFTGYLILGLLVFRLLVAGLVSDQSPWSLPWPRATLWRSFGRRIAAGELSVFLGRTPFVPLSALLLLGALVLVVLSGLLAGWWHWEDLHEAIAEGSLAVVLIHIGLVSLAPMMNKLVGSANRSPRAGRKAYP